MALSNFTLPFGGQGGASWGAAGPIHVAQQAANVNNNLLYNPADHQESSYPPPGDHSNYYKNNPYAPPQETQPQLQQQQQQQYRTGRANNYLPPAPPQQQQQVVYNQQQQQQQQYHQQQQVQVQQNQYNAQNSAPHRTYGEGSYSSNPLGGGSQTQGQTQQFQQQQTHQYYSSNSGVGGGHEYSIQKSIGLTPGQHQQQYQQQQQHLQQQQQPQLNPNNNNLNSNQNGGGVINNNNNNNFNNAKPPGFVKVKPSSLTSIHPVLDYDDDEYYDDDDAQGNDNIFPGFGGKIPTVTPIQGPIFLRNGTVPVVPLFSYPTLNNGTFVQIPIWWTALSVALGFDIRGEIIRGVPCVKKNHQLFCPTAGNTYPLDRIENFIDENKALMRRMYGDFEMTTKYGPPTQQRLKKKRSTMSFGADEDFIDDIPGIPDMISPAGSDADPVRQEEASAGGGDSYFSKFRAKRQNNFNRSRTTTGGGAAGANTAGKNTSNQRLNPGPTNTENTGRVDACESKVEIVTPYWASNSAGKIRAIVNTQHFEQAIHQEVCTKGQTNRCGGDCGCEQKYKWHRLLAYDPDNDCKGIFMDWFLFPSCCVCRCNP